MRGRILIETGRKPILRIVVIIYEEGNGILLQYSYLESPMDRGAWRATIYVSEFSLSTRTYKPLDHMSKMELVFPFTTYPFA